MNDPKTFSFSDTSLKLLQFLTQPLHTRQRVSYQPELLMAYQPQKSPYLGHELAQRLGALGTRGDASLADDWMIGVALASASLEGCAYTTDEANALAQHNKIAEHHSTTDTFLLRNHLEALRFIKQLAPDEDNDKNVLLNLHALLAYQLLVDNTLAGRVRNRAVHIGQCAYTPLRHAVQLEQHLEELLKLASTIPSAVEASLFLLVHLAYLQPFIDVNKRTARMAANIPLLRHHMAPLSFAGVAATHYNQAMLLFYETLELEPLREIFVWAYKQSCQHDRPPR